MSKRHHGTLYQRGPRFNVRTGIRETNRHLAHQDKVATRLERKSAARERKMAGQGENSLELAVIEPTLINLAKPIHAELKTAEATAPLSPKDHLLKLLSRVLPEAAIGFLRGIEFYAPGGPEDVEQAIMEKEWQAGRGGKEAPF